MPWDLTGTKLTRIKQAVLDRDGPHCRWCGVLTVKVPSGHQGGLLPEHRTLDHVRRRRDGGADEPGNIVIACHNCNNRDGRVSGSGGLVTESELVAMLANSES